MVVQRVVRVVLYAHSLCCLCYCAQLKLVPDSLQDAKLQVKLPQGTVQGAKKQTVDGALNYYSFEGIPYAVPPVGDLRFKAPLPAENWQGVLNSTGMYVPSCVQVTPSVLNGYTESEDCLYINVFTPINDLRNAKNKTLLPVMVWIYGGAFLFGAANSSYFGPDNLLEENVLVVHFGYRLGAFGFLSTGDLESPGNYGLKDQHLALRWVKKNIQYFGGNPDKVTIFGESAGSVSVQHQLMYHKNEGLFQGAISESGSALCIWAFQRQPAKIAFDLGAAAGIRTNNSKELVGYLMNLSSDKLKIATMKTSIKNSPGIIAGIPFAPTIEPQHDGALVTSKMHQVLLAGNFLKVPYIIGFNNEEAGIAKSALNMANPLLRFYNLSPGVLVPSGMNAGTNTNKVGEIIKKFYFTNSKSKADQYLEYINDGYFFRPIMESARLFGLRTPTYMYSFSYEGLMGRKIVGYSDVHAYSGVLHTEEMAYIWQISNSTESNTSDKTIKSRMLRIWTNFAKTGNPTPKEDPLLERVLWPKVSANMTYLDINNKLAVKQDFKHRSMMFWRELYQKYGKPPYDTY